MKVSDQSSNSWAKQRASDEIDAQIAEYLKRGGKIDVVDDVRQAPSNPPVGSVWRDDDISGQLQM